MRKIIINSNVSAEPVAILCSHLQNVQTHSIVITDCSNILHYGEDTNIGTNAGDITVYTKRFKDVVTAYSPDLVAATTADTLLKTINKIIAFVAEATLEQIENAVVYFGSTLLAASLIKELTTMTESTYVELIEFKSTEKLDNRFVWKDTAEDEAQSENAYSYTILYNKKYAKQAAKLKRPVIQLSEKDILAILEATRADKFVSTGVIKNTAIKICATQLNVPENSIESWLAQQK